MIPTRRRSSMSPPSPKKYNEPRRRSFSFYVLAGATIMPTARSSFTTRPVYLGRRGVLASGHYLAARAGQRMFDRGGNAIDATVASGFALNLLEPHLNGLGGEVPILVHSAKEGKVFSISGQGWAGKAATPEYFRNLKIAL